MKHIGRRKMRLNTSVDLRNFILRNFKIRKNYVFLKILFFGKNKLKQILLNLSYNIVIKKKLPIIKKNNFKIQS